LGVENIPLDGPLIFAANHRSYLDPPLLGIFCPRVISYMAKASLFTVPLLGAAIRSVGAFPVDRAGSATAAIKRSVEVLRAGGAIGLFPEGTRNRDGNAQPQQGVALLASLTGALVVPAGLIGTDKAQAAKLHQIRVIYGKPMRLPEGRKATREDLAKFTNDIMDAIQRLASGNS
jgi:1-acyl-sn-glycerol-3-phosphate acyltransferase